MRIVFMGTPDIAATILEYLADAYDVVAVYSRPDAVRGRGKKLVASPVKQIAVNRGIPVYTPSTLRDAEVQEELRSLNPDVICVIAYGAILPVEVLEIPRYGCLNVHASLLPRWRGAAPMQRAILAGDKTTGICVMRVEEGLDTGPYCKRVEVELDDLYLDDLECKLAEIGGKALVESIAQLEGSDLSWTAQSDDGVSYAQKIAKGELAFGPDEQVSSICAKVRASSDAHPAHAEIAGRGVTVVKVSPVADSGIDELVGDLEPGCVAFKAKRLFLGAIDGPVEVLELKPDGKKLMDARSFAAGVQGIKNGNITWERA